MPELNDSVEEDIIEFNLDENDINNDDENEGEDNHILLSQVYDIITTRKGKIALIYEGRKYYSTHCPSKPARIISSDEYEIQTNTIWKCKECRVSLSATCHTPVIVEDEINDGEVTYSDLKMCRNHSEFCHPSLHINIINSAITRIKGMVVSGEYNFPDAYNKVVSTGVDSVQAVHPFAISQMPSRLSLARTFCYNTIILIKILR
jgi:hypothetical protein